jgi:transcriptional regulator with XRE-family HTH domain
MARLVWARDEKPIGVTTDMLSKWERGAKGVSPRYRALLARVFKVSVDQLGLPGLARGQSDRRDDQSLVAVLDQAAELLDQLGDAGCAVRPQILAALTDEVLSRRMMLSVLDAPAPAQTLPTPAELDTLTDQYGAAHGTTTPAALMTALTAHLRMIGDALSRGPSAGTRQRLLSNRTRTALLAGQLAAEDLASPMAARAHYSQAIDDAFELDDPALVALSLRHAADLAKAQGQLAAALRHMKDAVRYES